MISVKRYRAADVKRGIIFDDPRCGNYRTRLTERVTFAARIRNIAPVNLTAYHKLRLNLFAQKLSPVRKLSLIHI